MTICPHQLHDTCLFQMNYSLSVFHVFLLVFVFPLNWCLNITCTTMSKCRPTLYQIEFAVAVYCYLVYRLFFFFFSFEHLIVNNSHILLVIVFYTTLGTPSPDNLRVFRCPNPRLLFVDVPVYL